MAMNRNWFTLLYGFQENYRACHENFTLLLNNGIPMLKSLKNEKCYRIGEFSTPTVGELKLKALNELKNRNSTDTRPMTTYSHCIVGDILEFHHQHPRATFQAASQFNCLEFASPEVTPEHGVTIYAHDHTQGPACALACASGTVYRNYFAVPSTNPEGVLGQSAESQLNNLDELEKVLENETHQYFTIRNGYTKATAYSLERLNQVLPNFPVEELIQHIKVGVHDDVGVTFSSRWNPIDEDVYVTQVYCSAISCAYTRLPTALWQPLAEIVLLAQYEATIWAAVLNHLRGGTNTVYLTFVGGGVYGNEYSWIGRSIGRAISIATKMDCGLNIVICHYHRINEEMKDIIDMSFELESQHA